MKPTDYAQLSRPFDHVFRDRRGGVQFDYFTGEQCVSRLMEQGPGFASFEIVEHGINDEADEVWVLGKLTCRIIEENPAYDADMPEEGVPRYIVVPTVCMQFGSQKIKRSRQNRQPLDIGFDLKGAATDALKKCASQGVGVGLYLWRKEGGIPSIPDDGIPIEAEYTEGDGMGARRCSARLGDDPGNICPEIVPAGEPIMASMREFDRPLCGVHFQRAREHIAALARQEQEAHAKTLQSDAETATDLAQEMLDAAQDAPQSPTEAPGATESTETTEETEEGNQAPTEDSDIRVINGRNVRARTCDAKNRKTKQECGVKLWPGTTATYGDAEFKVSILISESLAKHKRVLCPEHYVKMNEYVARQQESAPVSA